jgi:disulfide bond formation protein DsbB
MALGVIFLVAALHAPVTAATYIYAVLIGLAAMGGAGVAGRHVWLQNLPPDKVPACGPGLDFMLDAFPLAEVLQMVLSGSGECAEVSWSLLGLSMPAWLLVAFAGLGFAGVLVNCVRQRNP